MSLWLHFRSFGMSPNPRIITAWKACEFSNSNLWPNWWANLKSLNTNPSYPLCMFARQSKITSFPSSKSHIEEKLTSWHDWLVQGLFIHHKHLHCPFTPLCTEILTFDPELTVNLWQLAALNEENEKHRKEVLKLKTELANSGKLINNKKVCLCLVHISLV